MLLAMVFHKTLQLLNCAPNSSTCFVGNATEGQKLPAVHGNFTCDLLFLHGVKHKSNLQGSFASWISWQSVFSSGFR